jgi:DeoR family transcriptional regulator, deoxyribose operon repressor
MIGGMRAPSDRRASPGREASERRVARLRKLVEARGTVPLKEAAALLDVSTMTVRRDLAGGSSPLACLGAHIVGSQPAATAKYSLESERDQHASGKMLACRRAAELVRDGDSLFIDCGTTLPHLAEALPPGISLSVVCYSLNVATILAQRPNTQLMLLGGAYHSAAATFFSEEGVRYLRRLGVDKAFISAAGVHAERGASCANFDEVPIKQAAIASAAESFLVVDDSKLGRLKPAFFSPLDVFSRIIVGGRPERAVRTQFKNVPLDIQT